MAAAAAKLATAATAAAKDEKDDNDPPAAIATKTVTVEHKMYSVPPPAPRLICFDFVFYVKFPFCLSRRFFVFVDKSLFLLYYDE